VPRKPSAGAAGGAAPAESVEVDPQGMVAKKTSSESVALDAGIRLGHPAVLPQLHASVLPQL